MWLLVVFFLFDPGQIRHRASVRLSSCFFYLLTHHNSYPPQMKFLATPLLVLQTASENIVASQNRPNVKVQACYNIWKNVELDKSENL